MTDDETMSNVAPWPPLTLEGLRESMDKLGPPQWVATTLVLAPDVAASLTARVVTLHAAGPFTGVPIRVIAALVPGHAFVEEKRSGRVRYRRLLPTTADVCECACHGDSEEGAPHDEGDCCPDLEDADAWVMGVDPAHGRDATDVTAYVAHCYAKTAESMRVPVLLGSFSSQPSLEWEHEGLVREAERHREAWEQHGRRIHARLAFMLRDPKPRTWSTYLAWVRRHAPKRRRFDGPTRKQVARAWSAWIANQYAAFVLGETTPGAMAMKAAMLATKLSSETRWMDGRRRRAHVMRALEGTGG